MGLPSDITAIAQQAARQLERMVPAHAERLETVARDVAASLNRAIRLNAGSGYAAQQARVNLAGVEALVEAAAARHADGVVRVNREYGARAAAYGQRAMQAQIKAWAALYPSVRPLVDVQLSSALLGQSLLEYYDTSRETYGQQRIGRMKAALARGALRGDTLAATWESLAAELAIPKWKAERIARTEHSFAFHAREMADFIEVNDGDLGAWRKQLIATFDPRTGADSVSVHEQVRRIGQPFEDNEGRVYQHPPNRPHDREVLVFVPVESLTPEQRR